MLNQFPYTNFHEMNLDWVLSKLKDILDKVDNIYSLLNLFVPEYKGVYDPSNRYDPLNVVYYNGGYYMAGKYVPVGVTPDSEGYWINISPTDWSLLSQFEYPDKYPGDSDSDRLQACFDACNNRIGTVILLVKNYTMDKNIKLPYNPNNYQNMTIIGLGAGASINMGKYHFYGDSSQGAQYAGGYSFENIFLYGSDYLFDADTLIRINCINCGFQDFTSVVHSETRGYMQDYNFDLCRFRNVEYAIRGRIGMYSGGIRNSRFGESGVFYITEANISKFEVVGCDIETYGHENSPIRISGQAKGLRIDSNYIEPFDNQALRFIDCRDCNSGSIVVSSNYYSPNGAPGALIEIAGNYANVSYTIFGNTLVGTGDLLKIYETSHHDLKLLDIGSNDGGSFSDQYGSIPLFRGCTAQNCYPGKEIILFVTWGTGEYLDLPLPQPDLTGLAYSTAGTWHYYVDTDGSFKTDPIELTVQRLDNRIRLKCDAADRAKLSGKTVAFGITFNY